MILGAKRTSVALLVSVAGAAGSNPPGDRWAELAAAHEPRACIRCSPPATAGGSVAAVLRRMRHEAVPGPSTHAARIDLAADLQHVAAAPADDQDRLAMRLAEEIARADLRAAGEFAAALPPGRVRNGAMLVVVHRWVFHDRRAALQWAQALPDEAARASALHEVTRHLVAADPRGAVALVSALPEGPGRADALCAAARNWARIDRAAAQAWARELADASARARLVATLAD